MRNDRFNQNRSDTRLQSFSLDLNTAQSNQELPIAGNFLMMDKMSIGSIQLDVSGDARAVNDGSALITLSPGDVLRVPFSRPRATWFAQGRAKGKLLYGTNVDFLSTGKAEANDRGTVDILGGSGAINFVAQNSFQPFNVSIRQGMVFDLQITAYYPVLTADTLSTLLHPTCTENAGGLHRVNVTTEAAQIVVSATGWDVLQTFRVKARAAVSVSDSLTISYGFNLLTLNAAVITRGGSFRYTGVSGYP